MTNIQRKDALVAWRPLVKPMYEAREEKRICRDIIERMGFDADDAYPKSNYDQWLGYFLGCASCPKTSPVGSR